MECKRNAYRVLVRKTERDYFEDLSIDNKIIFKYILKYIVFGSVKWIDMALDMNKWQGVMNMTIKFQAKKKNGEFIY